MAKLPDYEISLPSDGKLFINSHHDSFLSFSSRNNPPLRPFCSNVISCRGSKWIIICVVQPRGCGNWKSWDVCYLIAPQSSYLCSYQINSKKGTN
ncbi:hypothetical protein L1887_03336 [Cichorium endivia]|nr:hypothetical protein L1887_03336 [Cichorium endivia]